MPTKIYLVKFEKKILQSMSHLFWIYIFYYKTKLMLTQQQNLLVNVMTPIFLSSTFLTYTATFLHRLQMELLAYDQFLKLLTNKLIRLDWSLYFVSKYSLPIGPTDWRITCLLLSHYFLMKCLRFFSFSRLRQTVNGVCDRSAEVDYSFIGLLI